LKATRDNSQLGKNIRNRARASASIPAIVVDTYLGRASVRLVNNGAFLRNLDVIGGPVKIGDAVRVDFTTAKPTVVVVGQQGLSHKDVMDIVTGQDPLSWHKVTYPPLQASTGEGGGGHIIEDEGVPLPARRNLNFIGDQVTVTDNSSGSASDVVISGLPLALYHNGEYIGLVNGLNFVDDDCS
jgi:hypothetical protein